MNCSVLRNILCVVLLCYMRCASASSSYNQIALDDRIRLLEYSPDIIYDIVLRSGYSSCITLGNGESISDSEIAGGTAVPVTIRSSAGKICFNVISNETVNTNMLVTTNRKRSYALHLDIRKNESVYYKEEPDDVVYEYRFKYVDDVKSSCGQSSDLYVNNYPSVAGIVYSGTSDVCKYVDYDVMSDVEDRTPSSVCSNDGYITIKFENSVLLDKIVSIADVNNDNDESLSYIKGSDIAKTDSGALFISGVHDNIVVIFDDGKVIWIRKK